KGSVPTGIVAITCKLLMTVTVPSAMSVTNSFCPSGVRARVRGSGWSVVPTLSSVTLKRLTSFATLKSVTELLSRFTTQTKASSVLMATGLELVGRGGSVASAFDNAARIIRGKSTNIYLYLSFQTPVYVKGYLRETGRSSFTNNLRGQF